MKKSAYFFLVVFLYLFMVALRVVGQLYNGTPVNWKATLTLGELDNTQDYGPRWTLRLITLLLFPLVWVNGLEKWIKKTL